MTDQIRAWLIVSQHNPLTYIGVQGAFGSLSNLITVLTGSEVAPVDTNFPGEIFFWSCLLNMEPLGICRFWEFMFYTWSHFFHCCFSTLTVHSVYYIHLRKLSSILYTLCLRSFCQKAGCDAPAASDPVSGNQTWQLTGSLLSSVHMWRSVRRFIHRPGSSTFWSFGLI